MIKDSVSKPIKNYILIHGAWHASWIWRDIIPLIKISDGSRVLAPDLPGHGMNIRKNFKNITLATYVDYITCLVELLPNNSVVLVGHSMAGIIISQVAENIPDKISRLIYVSSFIPSNNGSLIEEEQKSAVQNVAKIITIDEDSRSISINNTKKIQRLFYNDCNDEDIRYGLTHFQKQPLLPFLDKIFISDQRFGMVPKLYIECLQDQAINIIDQRRMHSKVTCKVATLSSGHSPFFSLKSELADLINNDA